MAHDPWEPVNRGIYRFNDFGDRVLIKPVAKAYKTLVPSFMRRGVTNFADNLSTPRSAMNNFLQGKPKRGVSDLVRFVLNSTFGIAGLLDLASAAGLEEYDEDFGQTFAVWGMPDGPYVVLPFLGPSTLRDAFAQPLDRATDPLVYYDNSSVRDKLYVLRLIDLRARLLAAEGLLEDSKDRYITLRESYLQNRNYVIHDGDPPVDEDFYDDFEDFDEPAEPGQ
ncbi:MAG: VacJ family lipoprotein [Woeseiaceae bacterium]|nr:VacJ family lipoprotein [Woeseiaceae bacterium]